MLQWMGGSRRKVTTSRKSTQKRQKQYFEQRKRRQQQETAFKGNRIDGVVTRDYQKGNQSLDVLSLVSVSKITDDVTTQAPNQNSMSTMTDKGTHARSFNAVDASREPHDTSRSIPTITNHEKTQLDHFQPTGARTPSGHLLDTLHSERKNSSTARNTESEYHKGFSSTSFSILDLIGDDGASGSSGHHVHEAHVAFSVEGLGKMGTETPPQSPQRPGRIHSDRQSSYSKAAKKLNSSRNFNTILDNPEVEVSSPMQEDLMEDVEIPSSGNYLDSFSISPAGESVQLHRHQWETNCFYNEDRDSISPVSEGIQLDRKQLEKNCFFNEDRHGCSWNAYYPSLDDVVYEKHGLNHQNTNVTHNSELWKNDLPYFKFEETHIPAKFQEKVVDKFDFLDGGSRHFPTLHESESPFTCNDHFQDDSSSHLKGARDNLTWLSGESCSSTEVKEGDAADMPPRLCRRRCSRTLQLPSISNLEENGGIWNKRMGTVGQGEEYDRLQKHKRSSSSNFKSDYFSPVTTFDKKNPHDEDWLLDEDFPSCHTNSHPSFLQSFEESQHCSDDLFSTGTEADLLHNSSHTFGMPPDKDSPHCFMPESTAFCQPFSSKQSPNTTFFSKTSFGGNWLGVHPDFRTHVHVSNSLEVADCFEEAESGTANADLSAQGSVTEEGEDKTKTQQPHSVNTVQNSSDNNNNAAPDNRFPGEDTNLMEDDSLDGVRPKNGCLTDSVANASKDVDGKLVTDKGLQGNARAVSHEELKGKNVNFDNSEGPQASSMPLESSYQLMMFQKCVQFLCVLKS